MNKSELIELIAIEADLSKAAAGRALDALIDGVKEQLRRGNDVALLGFGTFAASKRPARMGRNPRTGEPLKIKATKVVKFRSGAALKEAVNP
jgi:DNA-binding protein HU-beta